MPTDIGNANWWGRQFSVRGWVLHVRIRRKGRRQTYREWLTVKLYNYNYSEEAREKSRIFPNLAWNYPREGGGSDG